MESARTATKARPGLFLSDRMPYRMSRRASMIGRAGGQVVRSTLRHGLQAGFRCATLVSFQAVRALGRSPCTNGIESTGLRVLWLAASLLISGSTAAAQARDCYRFSFGEWKPPLEWNAAGHERRPSGALPQAPGGHGKLAFVDSARAGEIQLTVFPAWWPAGVIVRLRSRPVAGDTLAGTATAYVADGRATPPTAGVRAWPGVCRGPGVTPEPPL